MLADPPDILLTTPESLEAMLVSRRVDHERFLGSVRAVVVDELHAFAGSDRGWHLLAVLERVERIAGHKIQRVGSFRNRWQPRDGRRLDAGARPRGAGRSWWCERTHRQR